MATFDHSRLQTLAFWAKNCKKLQFTGKKKRNFWPNFQFFVKFGRIRQSHYQLEVCAKFQENLILFAKKIFLFNKCKGTGRILPENRLI